MSNTDWRDRLRDAITRSGRKHSAVARAAGVAPETLSRILTGADGHPRFETVVRITHAAGERVGWLLAEPGIVLSAVQQRQLRALLDGIDAEQEGT